MLIDKSHELSAVLIRPFSALRGVGRVAKVLNSTHLRLGASPLKIAKLRTGARLIVDLRSQTMWYPFYSGIYDNKYIKIINKLVKDEGNVLDVGANIGFYCVQIAHYFSDTQKVFCFEPVSMNYARLLENIELNALNSKVATFEFGLSDQNCKADITLREDFQGGSGTGNAALSISPEADSDFQRSSVSLRRLDDLIEEIEFGDVRVIKVDIEGHEDHFLAGAQDFLKLKRPIIFLEINKPYYRFRGVELNETFVRVTPENYFAYKIAQLGASLEIKRVSDLNSLMDIENIFLCPIEAIDLLRHAVSGGDRA